jgi:hypothetical protein
MLGGDEDQLQRRSPLKTQSRPMNQRQNCRISVADKPTRAAFSVPPGRGML